MIEQSIVHLPELVKDIERPMSIYLVHLSSFWCEIEERTTLGIGSPIRFGLWSDSSIIEPPTFGLWCRGWSSALPSPPICQTLPRLYPDNDQDVPGAS